MGVTLTRKKGNPTVNLEAFMELSATDLGIIASVLTVLGDSFALLAILKTKEEELSGNKNT
ncbi:hypothetical protein D3C76_946680 [compost metagenome]